MPEYRRGDPLRISFEAGSEARILIFEQKPDGGVSRLYPEGPSSPVVRAGESASVPVEGPAGVHRIRIVALPPEADPLVQAPDWPRLDGRIGAAEVQFRVTN